MTTIPHQPVIGVEFLWKAVSNGDGGELSLFVTVVNVEGHFVVRADQTGPSGGILTILRPSLGDLVVPIEPGSRALITLQESVAFALPWAQVVPRLILQSGRAAAAARGKGRRS